MITKFYFISNIQQKELLRNLYFSSSSTKTPLFTYNEKLQGVLSRHRSPSEEKKSVESSDKLKSHELEVLESQAECTRPLDFRLSEAESTTEARDEKIGSESAKKGDFHESSKKSSLSKDAQVTSVFHNRGVKRHIDNI